MAFDANLSTGKLYKPWNSSDGALSRPRNAPGSVLGTMTSHFFSFWSSREAFTLTAGGQNKRFKDGLVGRQPRTERKVLRRTRADGDDAEEKHRGSTLQRRRSTPTRQTASHARSERFGCVSTLVQPKWNGTQSAIKRQYCQC